MKLLFLLDHFYPYIGGGETLFYKLTVGLAQQGHRVTVITSHYKTDLAREEEMDGVRIVRVGNNRISFQRHAIIQGIKELKSGGYDLIHGSTYFSMIPTWIVSAWTGVKSVLTVHEVYGRLRYQFVGWMGWINYLYEWFCLTVLAYDHYVCVSTYTKNCMRVMYGIPDSKLSTVYNGIDYEFRNPATLSGDETQALRLQHHLQDNFVGLYFGRMGLAKGMDDVLRSLVETIKLVPNYKQVFITPKKQQAKLLGVKNTFSVSEVQEFINKHHLQDHVIRLESLPIAQLKHWIGLADVVILPSRAEGFGFAVSEVCALNRPLITTSVASIPEVVYGKVNFVEPSNEHDISHAVAKFSHDEYEMIGKKVFERDECVKKTGEIYDRLLKK